MKGADETLWQVQDEAGTGTTRAVGEDSLFVFAGFTLDTAGNTLSRHGLKVRLRPKSLALLKYLIERRGETVSKHTLAAVVWPVPPADIDASIAQCIKDIRAVLGADSRGLLQTVPGIGYVFRGQVVTKHPHPPQIRTQAMIPAPAPRRISWRRGGAFAALAVAGGAAFGMLFARAPANDPANDPLAVQESYRYRPVRTISNAEVVTIKTDEGKTMICRGGNDSTRTRRKCWWSKS